MHFNLSESGEVMLGCHQTIICGTTVTQLGPQKGWICPLALSSCTNPLVFCIFPGSPMGLFACPGVEWLRIEPGLSCKQMHALPLSCISGRRRLPWADSHPDKYNAFQNCLCYAYLRLCRLCRALLLGGCQASHCSMSLLCGGPLSLEIPASNIRQPLTLHYFQHLLEKALIPKAFLN